MEINLTGFEEVLAYEVELHDLLKLPPTTKVEIALDTVHALNDLTRSLADLHPHKRSIATLGALPEPLSRIATSFASQGYTIQEIPVSFLVYEESALQSAWETLKKDTLFVLMSYAEPFTGAIYPVDFVRKEAAKKSIFSLIYQSPDALKRGIIIPETAFEGIVVDALWGTAAPLSLILKGDRCQGEKLLWGHSRYNQEAVKNLAKKVSGIVPGGEDRPKVIDFENQMKMHMGHSIHCLGEKIPRIFDRSVFFVDGVDGEALTFELKKHKVESYTANACAWQNPHLNAWLPQLGIPVSWAQSSVILPVEQLNKSNLDTVLAAIQTLRKISGFES
jgi:hypothetical protein